MISCGHCGDRHATVAEVRSCSAEPGKAMRADEPTAPTEDRTGPGAVSAPEPVALLPDWAHLAGPASLARNLLVLPGQPAVGPWRDCPRIVVDDTPDGPAKVRAGTQPFSSKTLIVRSIFSCSMGISSWLLPLVKFTGSMMILRIRS